MDYADTLKTNSLKAIRSILLTELDIVTDTLINDLNEPDELRGHWLPRLAKVNKGLQFIEALDNIEKHGL